MNAPGTKRLVLASPFHPQPRAKVIRAGKTWAREKLELLRYYLGGTRYKGGGFMMATKRARATYYIDLFSGPGQTSLPSGEILDGSPLIAAKASPHFSQLFWVDADRKNASSLASHRLDYPDLNVEVYWADANAAIDAILAKLPRSDPVLAFLDPEGSELDWQTIEKLARHKAANARKIELFILFASDTGIVRFFPRDPTKLVHADKIDRMMPDAGRWRNLYQQRAELSPAEFRRGLLDEYVRGLRSLGYLHVPAPRLIQRPDGRPLYFMVFASDDPAGDKIMTAALRRVEDSLRQKTFLPYEQRY